MKGRWAKEAIEQALEAIGFGRCKNDCWRNSWEDGRTGSKVCLLEDSVIVFNDPARLCFRIDYVNIRVVVVDEGRLNVFGRNSYMAI